MAQVNQEPNICAICLQPLGENGPIRLTRLFRVPCNHTDSFHTLCACTWSGPCPLCNAQRAHFISAIPDPPPIPDPSHRRRRLMLSRYHTAVHIIDLDMPTDSNLMYMVATELWRPRPHNDIVRPALPGNPLQAGPRENVFHTYLEANLPSFVVTDIDIDFVCAITNRTHFVVKLRDAPARLDMYIRGFHYPGMLPVPDVRPL